MVYALYPMICKKYKNQHIAHIYMFKYVKTAPLFGSGKENFEGIILTDTCLNYLTDILLLLLFSFSFVPYFPFSLFLINIFYCSL